MVSIMQLDGLGKRYGLLPSEILRRADTFDLYIMDCALSFEDFHHKKSMNKGKTPIEYYDIKTLESINERTKIK